MVDDIQLWLLERLTRLLVANSSSDSRPVPASDDQTSYDQTALSPSSHPSTAVFSVTFARGLYCQLS